MITIMVSNFTHVAALILAGGQSNRAEMIKGLRQFKNKYWIDTLIDYFLSLGIKQVFVGLGYDFNLYQSQSKYLNKCTVAINSVPQNGSFSTLQNTLIKALNLHWKNIILIHIDHALPESSCLEKLLDFANYSVIKPRYQNQSGHPIILNRKFCQSLLTQPQNSQLNRQIHRLDINQIKWVNVDDNNILENFNTKEKWDTYINNSK